MEETQSLGHRLAGVLMLLLLTAAGAFAVPQEARGQAVSGKMTVNGSDGRAQFVHAMEVASDTEPGFLDVLVVLSDRRLKPAQMLDQEAMEQLMFKPGLVAIRLLLDPDCMIKQVSYYHPAFEHFLVNAGVTLWEPSAFDAEVAGRLRTDGLQDFVDQEWMFDFTFSVPISLDPEATAVGD